MPVTHDMVVRSQLKDRAKLRSFVWAIVRDEHIVDDVLQEVYALAIEKAGEIHDERHLSLWMRRAARLEAFTALRQRSKSSSVFSEQVLDQLEQQWSELDNQDCGAQVEALRRCLGILTTRNRDLVRMRYVEGMTGVEIACALGRNVKSVYVAISRIHRALADCIRGHMKRLNQIYG